jgi:hypothetical protein
LYPAYELFSLPPVPEFTLNINSNKQTIHINLLSYSVVLS